MSEAGAFFYETEIEWSHEREGKSSGPQLPTIPVGAPPEFKGREGNWTPEHLFVASVNTCLMLTLLAIAENSKLNLVGYRSTAKGKLEKVQGAGYQITEIVVRPKVVVASAEDLRRVPKILEKAKEGCFISNSIKSAVKLEPEISQQIK
jgi:organic hydroperoxide reductase OsmC/OhrA